MKNFKARVASKLAGAALAWAGGGLSFAGAPSFIGGTATWTHNPDASAAGPVIYNVPVNSIPSNASPVPFQLTRNNYTYDNPGVAGASVGTTSATGGVGYFSNPTTAGIAFAAGTGVTQLDPSHNFAGSSSLKLTISNYSFTTSSQFGAFSQGYFSIAVAGNVAPGSTALFNASINFVNSSNVSIISTPMQFSGTFTGGAFAQVFTDQKIFNGTGIIASGQTIKMIGTIDLKARNDAGLVTMSFGTAEVSSAPPTSTIGASAVGLLWDLPASWSNDSSGGPDSTPISGTVPNHVGDRARFIGDGPVLAQLDSPRTIGTLDIDRHAVDQGTPAPVVINNNGNNPSGKLIFDTMAGAGDAVINIGNRYGGYDVAVNTPLQLNKSVELIVDSAAGVSFGTLITGAGGIHKTGVGPATFSASVSVPSLSISGGVVHFNGLSTFANGVDVAGGTLRAQGSLAAAVSVQNNGTLASDGTFNMASLVSNSGAIQTDVGAQVRRLNVVVGNGLTLNGLTSVYLNAVNAGSIDNGQSVLLDYTGSPLANLNAIALATPTVGDFYASLVNNTANTSIDLLLLPIVSHTGTWLNPSSGLWSAGSNWQGGVVPGGINDIASFSLGTTVVVLDSARTIGTMSLGRGNYNISGNSTLTFDVGSGGARIDAIPSGGGTVSMTIAAPIKLMNDLTINAVGNASVTLTHTINEPAASISVIGGGVATFGGVRVSSLTVSSGAAAISPGSTANDPSKTSVVKHLNVLGTLDLTNNSMVLDYDLAGTDAEGIRQLLAGGTLISSTATPALHTALGFADNMTLGKTTFAGQTVDPTSVLIKYTYLGDADLDGDVDISDLGLLATHWQSPGLWNSGDFNYDGLIDISDLGVLAQNWQLGVGSPLGQLSWERALDSVGLSSVPEPTAAFAMVAAGAVALSRRVRRRY